MAAPRDLLMPRQGAFCDAASDNELPSMAVLTGTQRTHRIMEAHLGDDADTQILCRVKVPAESSYKRGNGPGLGYDTTRLP